MISCKAILFFIDIAPQDFGYIIIHISSRFWIYHYSYFLKILDISLFIFPQDFGYIIIHISSRFWIYHYSYFLKILDISLFIFGIILLSSHYVISGLVITPFLKSMDVYLKSHIIDSLTRKQPILIEKKNQKRKQTQLMRLKNGRVVNLFQNL